MSLLLRTTAPSAAVVMKPSPSIFIVLWLLAVGPAVADTMVTVTLHPVSLCPVRFDFAEDIVKGGKTGVCLLLLTACQSI